MGWVLEWTHLGVIIIGSFSTRCRIISKLTEPAPMIIPALNQMHCSLPGQALKISPVSMRLLRCRLALSLFHPEPAQVDNPLDVIFQAGVTKIFRASAVSFFKVPTRPHGMNEVIGHINAV